VSSIPPREPQGEVPSNPNPFLPPEYDSPVVELADQDYMKPNPQRLSAGGIVSWLMIALAVSQDAGRTGEPRQDFADSARTSD